METSSSSLPYSESYLKRLEEIAKEKRNEATTVTVIFGLLLLGVCAVAAWISLDLSSQVMWMQ